MSKFNVPDRKYVDGPKKMVSWRLPESLMKQIDKKSKDKGWSTTELVVTVLDQYIQHEEEKEN